MASTNTTAADVVTTKAIAYLSSSVAALVMFGISCSVTSEAVKHVSHHASAFVIGLASQVFVMPALTYAAAVAFRLPPVHAFTLVVLGCCPGGTTSNMITYFAGGDMALSIALTATTNSFAIGTLPLLLYLWADLGLGSTGISIRIPYDSTVGSLCGILAPAAAGVFLRARRPALARMGEKVGAVLGGVTIAATVVFAAATNIGSLGDPELLPMGALGAVIVAAPCGMLFAFVALWIRRRGARSGGCGCCCGGGGSSGGGVAAAPSKGAGGSDGEAQWLTVVLETGMQNASLALAVANITISSAVPARPATELLAAQLIIAVWAAVTTIEAVLVVLALRWRRGKRLVS